MTELNRAPFTRKRHRARSVARFCWTLPYVCGCSTSTVPARHASAKSCYIQLMFTILKRTQKNFMISDKFYDYGVGSFPEIFHFRLQKVQNVLYLKKCIFNIFFFLPSRSKAEHFLRRKGLFPKSARKVFCEKQNAKEQTHRLSGARDYAVQRRTALASLPNNNLL